MLDNAYRQDIITRMLITRVELITTSIVIIRSIWHKYTADFLCSGKFPRTFENLVAPPTNGNMKRLVRCKEHPDRKLKVRQNRSIIGDAIVHQTGKK